MNPDVIDPQTLQGSTTADGPPAVQYKYKISHKHSGVVLIFNHRKFKNDDERHGSDKDVTDLKKVLLKLRFDVRVFVDLTEDQVFKTLSGFLEHEDHTDHDCLMVVMMTHGERGTLLAADTHATNRPPYKVERLWEHFNASPGLEGKPKLVFIQACRGEQVDPGVTVTVNPVADTGVTTDASTQEDNGDIFSTPPIPDLLVVYSTYDRHYAFRDQKKGSWFIQSLAENLTEYGSKLDVLNLLTVLLRNVALNYISKMLPNDSNMDQMKQMPCIVSTLTKPLYFRQK